MIKICIVGAFGFDDLKNATGGQPVKTRELYYGLNEKYGKENVLYVETYQWKKKLIRMLWQMLQNIPKSDRIIMLPAHNGLKVFLFLLRVLKKRKARLYYDVIGGWLPQIAKNDSKLLDGLAELDGIWVETTSMRDALRKLGLRKISVVPNFKSLEVLNLEQLPDKMEKPYKLCTFSRVTEEKGITDAIEAVCFVNTQMKSIMYKLEIYGPIASEYMPTFTQLLEQYSDFISYKGIVSPNDSVTYLKDYFALLFPTKFYTEGIPGTIIDAYSAGIPVVTARWLNYSDVFEEGVTGMSYAFAEKQELEALLLRVAEQPALLHCLKENCLRKAKQYTCTSVITQITLLLSEDV